MERTHIPHRNPRAFRTEKSTHILCRKRAVISDMSLISMQIFPAQILRKSPNGFRAEISDVTLCRTIFTQNLRPH